MTAHAQAKRISNQVFFINFSLFLLLVVNRIENYDNLIEIKFEFTWFLQIRYLWIDVYYV